MGLGLAGDIQTTHINDTPMFSELDVVKAVTGHNPHYSTMLIRMLPEAVKLQVREGATKIQPQDPGQRERTFITYKGVLTLIMSLPGNKASEFRAALQQAVLYTA